MTVQLHSVPATPDVAPDAAERVHLDGAGVVRLVDVAGLDDRRRVVSFAVPRGEMVAIMGPSGSGTTTLPVLTAVENVELPPLVARVPAKDARRRLSAHVGLLVVGSRAWDAVRRVVLGSTSDRLMHHAACPVLVTPRGATVAASGTPARSREVSAG